MSDLYYELSPHCQITDNSYDIDVIFYLSHQSKLPDHTAL